MQSNDQSFGRNPPRQPPKPIKLRVDKDHSFRLSVSCPKKAVQLLRLLLTRFYQQDEELGVAEKILLDLLLMYLSEVRNMPLSDMSERRKLKFLSLMSLSRLWLTFRDGKYPSWAIAQVAILRKNQVLMNPREFHGLINQLKVEKFIKLTNRAMRRDHPPLAYIGVGYRDKGTAADVSFDASPSWQDVASLNVHHSNKSYAFVQRKTDFITTFRLIRPYKLGIV